MKALAGIAALVFYVGEDMRNNHCESKATACYARGNPGTVYMRDYYDLPAGVYVLEIPADTPFPSFRSNKEHLWRRCGWHIQSANSMKLTGHSAAVICHEAKHAFMHHNGLEGYHHEAHSK